MKNTLLIVAIWSLMVVACNTQATAVVLPTSSDTAVSPTPTITPTLPPTATPTPASAKLAHLSGLILLGENRGRDYKLLVVPADRSNERRLEISAWGEFASSPDAATIIHALNGAIYKVDLSTGTERLLLNMGDGYIIGDLSFSPDGSRLAFTAYRTLYVLELVDRNIHELYSSSQRAYSGGYQAACQFHYLMWADNSRLTFNVGDQLPGAISVMSGDSDSNKQTTVDCGGLAWHEVDTASKKEKRVDHVSWLSREFEKQMENSYPLPCQLSPDSTRAVCEESEHQTQHIVEQNGEVLELNKQIGYVVWSFDSRYIMWVGSNSLWIVPADLSEPPTKFLDRLPSWPSPILWLPPSDGDQ